MEQQSHILMKGQRIFRVSSLCLLAALWLIGCGDKPQLRPLPADATIVAFGDSLTSGVGVSTEHSYPAVLAQELNLRVINAGVPGEVTEEGKERLKTLLKEIRPDLLLICHGGNDFLHRLSEADTEKNVHDMVSLARSMDIDVAMIGVPKPGIWGRAPELYKRVASTFAVPLDDETLGELETDRTMKSDPVHLNEQGYRRLAEAVVMLLVKAGAVSP